MAVLNGGVLAPLRASFALAANNPHAWAKTLDEGDRSCRARLSFLAFLIASPLILLSTRLDRTASGGPSWAMVGHILLADLVAWLAFAAFSDLVLQRAGREGSWMRLVTVWNWCNVVQLTLLILALVPGRLAVVPGWAKLWAALVFWGWAIWLDWRAIKFGLGDRPEATWPAVGLTLADIAIGLLCQAIASSLPGWS